MTTDIKLGTKGNGQGVKPTVTISLSELNTLIDNAYNKGWAEASDKYALGDLGDFSDCIK